MNSPCSRCGQPFERPTDRFTVCPPCRHAVRRAAKKRWKEQSRAATRSIAPDYDDEWFLRKLCVRTATEVAEICGLTRGHVLAIERRAIRKLRTYKDALKEACEEFPDNGSSADCHCRELDLIDFQISVGEWWALADHLAAVGKISERDECIAQIGRFQRKISEYLNSALS